MHSESMAALPAVAGNLDGDGTLGVLTTMSGPVAAGLDIVILLRRAYPLAFAFCGTRGAIALKAG